MDEKDKKDLIKIQRYAQDSIPVYEMMVTKAKDIRTKEALKKIISDKQSHVRLLEGITGKSLETSQSDKAFMKGMRMVFGFKNTLNVMAQSEYDAANDHEKSLGIHPGVKRIVADERRHGDALVRLKKMKQAK